MNEEESLHSAINEQVALHPYNSLWPAIFATERTRLESQFPDAFIDIQHFGSTAVPGLIAKPIIDILAGVESMAVADALIEPLCQTGYTTSAEFNATLSDRRWLMKWADGHRTHHLHIVVHGGDEWHRRVAFRNALRSNNKLAEHYSLLKKELALRFLSDREAYTDAKAKFVESVLASSRHPPLS